MANDNCLEGFACPQCGYEDSFEITAPTTATVTDEGTVKHEGLEWDEKSPCECCYCHHRGPVAEFRGETTPGDNILVIHLDGGLVQEVCAPDPEKLRDIDGVFVVDYDTEGIDEDELSDVLQSDGSTSEAYVRGLSIDCLTLPPDQFLNGGIDPLQD